MYAFRLTADMVKCSGWGKVTSDVKEDVREPARGGWLIPDPVPLPVREVRARHLSHPPPPRVWSLSPFRASQLKRPSAY